MKNPGQLIDSLMAYRKRNASVFNPWVDTCEFDIDQRAPQSRQDRLLKHLSIAKPKYILVGEAAGYQGCRYSGVTFTSEKMLLNEGIPRVLRLTERLTNREIPFCEPSATIVWGALRKNGIAEQTILWNTFPFHPMRGSPIHSNRTPTTQEIEDGAKFLVELLALYEAEPKIIAVGKKAQFLLTNVGIRPLACVRHPAFGGANEFRAGLAAVVKDKS